MNGILKALGSRAALNSYFWLTLFFVKLGDISYLQGNTWGKGLAIMLYFLGLIAVFSYINNLVLIPRRLKSELTIFWLKSAGLLALLIVSYTLSIHVFAERFPELQMQRISLITYPVNPVLSFKAVTQSMPYFALGLFLWWIPFSVAGFYHDNFHRMQRMEKRLLEHRTIELQFLKNQVNPHFLFNTLNNLYALSLENSSKTPGYILKLSEVFRYMLYDSNIALVDFNKEREILQSFIDIELLRSESDKNFHFTLYADDHYQIPPLIWLPVVENIFKHTRQMTDPEIHFLFEIRHGRLLLVSENPLTTKAPTSEDVGGIGLDNLRKRLQILYPETHSLVENRDNELYSLRLEINLKP